MLCIAESFRQPTWADIVSSGLYTQCMSSRRSTHAECRYKVNRRHPKIPFKLAVYTVQCMIHVNDALHSNVSAFQHGFFILFLHHFITIPILPWLLCKCVSLHTDYKMCTQHSMTWHVFADILWVLCVPQSIHIQVRTADGCIEVAVLHILAHTICIIHCNFSFTDLFHPSSFFPKWWL